MYQGRPLQQSARMGRGRGRDARPRNRDEAPPYCTYQCSYSHDTTRCWDIVKHPNHQWRSNCSQRDETPQQGRQCIDDGTSHRNRDGAQQRHKCDCIRPKEGRRHSRSPSANVGRDPILEIDTIDKCVFTHLVGTFWELFIDEIE